MSTDQSSFEFFRFKSALLSGLETGTVNIGVPATNDVFRIELDQDNPIKPRLDVSIEQDKLIVLRRQDKGLIQFERKPIVGSKMIEALVRPVAELVIVKAPEPHVWNVTGEGVEVASGAALIPLIDKVRHFSYEKQHPEQQARSHVREPQNSIL